MLKSFYFDPLTNTHFKATKDAFYLFETSLVLSCLNKIHHNNYLFVLNMYNIYKKHNII